MNAKINTVISSLGLADRPVEHRMEQPLARTSFEIIFLTGISGWLLSYLVIPPPIPGEAAQISRDAGAD